MTDLPVSDVPTDVPPTVDTKPAKRPGLIRWWGLIVLVVFVLLFVVGAPWIVQPWVLGKIRNGLAANGWELTPESQLRFSLYGGQLSGENLTMRMIAKDAQGTQAQVATCSRLNIDIAMMETLGTRDLIVSELAAEGLTGNLRRGPDGRISTIPPDPNEPATGSGTDWSKVDWVSWYQKGMERYKKWSSERQAQTQTQQQQKPGDQPAQPTPGEPTQSTTAQRPAPQTDVEWPQAVRHQPVPTQGRRIPRILVRKLSLTGTGVKLPDQSPFEIEKFSVTGVDVSDRQNLGETMTVQGTFATSGAGEATLDLARNADDTGHLRFAAPSVPVAVLGEPAIAGDRFAQYGATGNAAVTLDNQWTGWDLTGGLTATVTGLAMKPTTSDGRTQQVARFVDALKGKPITWPIKLGGTLFAPTITDTGVDDVLKGGVMDAAKAAATEKATQEAQKLLDKQADKNPQVKKATDSLKGLLGK